MFKLKSVRKLAALCGLITIFSANTTTMAEETNNIKKPENQPNNISDDSKNIDTKNIESEIDKLRNELYNYVDVIIDKKLFPKKYENSKHPKKKLNSKIKKITKNKPHKKLKSKNKNRNINKKRSNKLQIKKQP